MAPADCLAAAREQFIICNSLVGRQLTNRLLVSGITREEIQRARLFIALTFLGHELGHLRADSPAAVQHLFPFERTNGLTCTHLDDHGPTEERLADEFGISAACEAVRLTPSEQDPRVAVNTLSHLRENLDEDYFAFDDTCAGDDRYPSMSRRKSAFSREYAQCHLPNGELPYAAVAIDQDKAFARLEEWLRERQVSGIVASAMYGFAPFYSFDVAATRSAAMYVAFDSSRTASQVSSTTVSATSVSHVPLESWDHSGNLVDARTISATDVEFLVAFSAPNHRTEVRRIRVKCVPQAVPCTSEQSSRMLPSGVRVVGTTSHAIVEVASGRLRVFASQADYIDSHAAFETSADADLTEERLTLDANATQLVVGAVAPKTQLASGFDRIGLLTGSAAQWISFSTLPTTSPLTAVGLYGQRLAFVLESTLEQQGGSTQLWVCPRAPFEDATRSTVPVQCDAYQPPADFTHAVGLANNDLSSLGTHFLGNNYCEGLIVLREEGWLWLVDPQAKKQDLIPGTGLVNCAADRSTATVFRMRRIDDVRLRLQDAKPRQATIGLLPTGALSR